MAAPPVSGAVRPRPAHWTSPCYYVMLALSKELTRIESREEAGTIIKVDKETFTKLLWEI